MWRIPLVVIADELARYNEISPWLQAVINAINALDKYTIAEHFNFRHSKQKDPYIYFYDDFLRYYNPQAKKKRGDIFSIFL